ncbi:hypothetical protein PMAYCL1PPCAC_03241, partial [Pristionchus mayeri]
LVIGNDGVICTGCSSLLVRTHLLSQHSRSVHIASSNVRDSTVGWAVGRRHSLINRRSERALHARLSIATVESGRALGTSGSGWSGTERGLALGSGCSLGTGRSVGSTRSLDAHTRHGGVSWLALQTGLARGSLGTEEARGSTGSVPTVESVGTSGTGRACASGHSSFTLTSAWSLGTRGTDHAGQLRLRFQLNIVSIDSGGTLNRRMSNGPSTRSMNEQIGMVDMKLVTSYVNRLEISQDSRIQ